MYMSDYTEHLDRILSATGKPELEGAGKVSHKQAMDKAEGEYRKYKLQISSPVEQGYLTTIKRLGAEAKKGVIDDN